MCESCWVVAAVGSAAGWWCAVGGLGFDGGGWGCASTAGRRFSRSLTMVWRSTMTRCWYLKTHAQTHRGPGGRDDEGRRGGVWRGRGRGESGAGRGEEGGGVGAARRGRRQKRSATRRGEGGVRAAQWCVTGGREGGSLHTHRRRNHTRGWDRGAPRVRGGWVGAGLPSHDATTGERLS